MLDSLQWNIWSPVKPSLHDSFNHIKYAWHCSNFFKVWCQLSQSYQLGQRFLTAYRQFTNSIVFSVCLDSWFLLKNLHYHLETPVESATPFLRCTPRYRQSVIQNWINQTFKALLVFIVTFLGSCNTYDNRNFIWFFVWLSVPFIYSTLFHFMVVL